MDKNQVLQSRRKFFSICLAGLGTVFTGAVFYSLFSYLIPPSRKGEGEVIKILKSELPDGGMKRFHIRGVPAVVINSKEGYKAYSLVCSHLGCLVNWDGEKNKFLCPCHGAQFNSAGEVLSGPPPKGLETFSLQEKDGELWIS